MCATPATICEPGTRCSSQAYDSPRRARRARLGGLSGRRGWSASRVAIVTTGDELVGVDEQARPGSVRNSGAFVIPALVRRAGAEAVSLVHARDDPAVIREAIDAALGPTPR